MFIPLVIFCLDLIAKCVFMVIFPSQGTRGLVMISVIEGIVIVFCVILKFPFEGIKVLKLPFARISIFLLFLALIGSIVGLGFEWPIRYFCSDIWKLVYIPFLYFLMIPYTRNLNNCKKLLLLCLVWGMSYKLIHSIFVIQRRGIQYLPMGSGMPYLSVAGLMFFLKKKSIYSYLLLSLGFLSAIASGQRTGLILNIIVFCCFILIFLIRKKSIYQITMFIFIIAFIFIYINYSLDLMGVYKQGYERQIKTLQTIEQEPRQYEFLDVISSFKCKPFIYQIVGLGNGALWTPIYTPLGEEWEWHQGKIHNIHITPVAILYRNGILGFLIWLYIFYLAFKAFIISYKQLIHKDTLANQIALLSAVLFLCANIYGLTAFHFLNPITQLPLPIYMILIDRLVFAKQYFLSKRQN